MEEHYLRFYDRNKFSDVFLPVRMAGRWLLIVQELKVRRTALVLFEDADYT